MRLCRNGRSVFTAEERFRLHLPSFGPALGVRFRVLDLPSLIKAKRAAGRPRDYDHLPELEALLALGKA